MTVTTHTRQRRLAARHVGYIAVCVINFWLLFVVNVSPGWEALPFLTADTDRVLFLFNAWVGAGLLTKLVYLAYDPAWLRSLGESVTAMVGLAALAQIWRVFPFDFRDYSYNWGQLVRIVLVVAITATLIGMLANLVNLTRVLPPRPLPH